MTLTVMRCDCRDVLPTLPDESVHCVVTSPPYWGLRDYGSDGQIGLEQTPTEYVATMVAVFRQVRRVLRKDGTLWLNLGDSYAVSSGSEGHRETPGTVGRNSIANHPKTASHAGTSRQNGLKPKDLIGIPWRVAFALQADGWWLRSDNVWAKPNGMPESVGDRPSRKHEYCFLLTKSARYFYDGDAVKLPAVPESVGRLARAMRAQMDGGGGFVISDGGYAPPGQPPHQTQRRSNKQRGHGRRHNGFNDRWDAMSKAEQQGAGARLGSVWWLPTANCREAHFAVMPEELAATCILAGCPRGGTVLDPFGGAGTTGLVADRLQRNAILIELNDNYADMAERRILADRGPLLMADR